MALITIDSEEILKVSKENPDALRGLLKLFPSVFKPTVPSIGDHYVRGNSVYVVASIDSLFFELINVESGNRWSDPRRLDDVFDGKDADFKKCEINITYAEIAK